MGKTIVFSTGALLFSPGRRFGSPGAFQSTLCEGRPAQAQGRGEGSTAALEVLAAPGEVVAACAGAGASCAPAARCARCAARAARMSRSSEAARLLRAAVAEATAASKPCRAYAQVWKMRDFETCCKVVLYPFLLLVSSASRCRSKQSFRPKGLGLRPASSF